MSNHLLLGPVLMLPTLLAVAGVAQAQEPPEIDLSGRWKDGARDVIIRQEESEVIAEYVEPYPLCDPQDGSEPQPYEKDFEATLSGDSLIGEVTVCNWGESWGGEIGIQEADMRLRVSPDGNTLSGMYESYPEPAKMTLTRGAPADCVDARRALLQAESLLEAHDNQMNAIAGRYDALVDQLTSMGGEFANLKTAADAEWNEFRVDAVFDAAQQIIGEFLPFPTDFGPIDDVQALGELYEFYQANNGTIAEMRAWSQQRNLRHIVRMLDHMASMYQTMGQMTMLRHDYEEMEVNREPLERNVEDARQRLEDCQAVG